MMKKLNNGFVISNMSDMKPPRVNVFAGTDLTELLNQKLKMSDYSEKIKEVGLIFMSIDPDTHSFRPDKKIWRWKSQVFDMYINVPDYNVFCTASVKEAEQIINKLFISGIDIYLSKRNDIDYKKLRNDVEMVFQAIV